MTTERNFVNSFYERCNKANWSFVSMLHQCGIIDHDQYSFDEAFCTLLEQTGHVHDQGEPISQMEHVVFTAVGMMLMLTGELKEPFSRYFTIVTGLDYTVETLNALFPTPKHKRDAILAAIVHDSPQFLSNYELEKTNGEAAVLNKCVDDGHDALGGRLLAAHTNDQVANYVIYHGIAKGYNKHTFTTAGQDYPLTPVSQATLRFRADSEDHDTAERYQQTKHAFDGLDKLSRLRILAFRLVEDTLGKQASYYEHFGHDSAVDNLVAAFNAAKASPQLTEVLSPDKINDPYRESDHNAAYLRVFKDQLAGFLQTKQLPPKSRL